MIITDKFVLLNFPKTGSSFVRAVIKSIYRDKINNTIWSKVMFKLGFTPFKFQELYMPLLVDNKKTGQHGKFFQIPLHHKNKKIVSVIRSPYERFESQYKYGYWKKSPFVPKAILKEHLPHFPNLTIDDFVILTDLHRNNMKKNLGIPDSVKIGPQSIEFVNMFFKEPLEFWKKIEQSKLKSNSVFEDMADVEFLRQENLNSELANFLLKNGFSHSEIELAKNFKKVNESSKLSNSRLTENAIDYVEKNEWFLFKILSSRNITYDRPN